MKLLIKSDQVKFWIKLIKKNNSRFFLRKYLKIIFQDLLFNTWENVDGILGWEKFFMKLKFAY